MNDRSPKFISDKYVFSIDEHSPAETLIGTVYAYDNDTTTANNKIYYMLGNDMYANLFAINVTTGEIYVNGKLLLLFFYMHSPFSSQPHLQTLGKYAYYFTVYQPIKLTLDRVKTI